MASLAAGCVYTTYTIQGAAAGVANPGAGPTAIGPLGAAGHVSAEGSLQENLVGAASNAPAPGAGEVRATTTVARARVSYTFRHDIELGLSGQVTDTSWSRVSSNGSPATDSGQVLFGAGAQFRAILLGNASQGFGLLAEAAFYSLSYADDFTYTAVTTGGFLSPGTTSTGTMVVRSSSLSGSVLGGPFGVFTLVPDLRLTVGGTLGTREVVQPSLATTFDCTSSCASGFYVPPFQYALQLTAFASLGYRVGPVTFITQLAVNAFGSSPLGGILGVRVTP